MWVLQSVLPKDSFIVAARGIHPLPTGGYHWSASPASTRVGFEDFKPAVESLGKTLRALSASHSFGREPFLMMGFSQGAASAFAALEGGIKMDAIIALAGFIPLGDLSNLHSVPIFWGHGMYDDLVPIERAREDVNRLLDSGVEVHFCEAEVGHKLGIECTRGLKQWIQGRILRERNGE
jgi:phospholipase/carboxylesterase